MEVFFLLFLAVQMMIDPSRAAIDTFVYGGCSQMKFTPGTPYESNVNSVLTSFVNSAGSANFNNYKISVPGSSQSDIVYGLYQCRGDLGGADCRNCVGRAVSQLGMLCVDTSGGALQLDGCFVKYDNVSFLGAEDKTVVSHKCGPPISYGSDDETRRDAVLSYLTAGGQYFRVGGSGRVQGVAQCTQDLSQTECQDCLSDAIGRLRNECGSAPWGDMFLSKCYARYSERGFSSKTGRGGCYIQQRSLVAICCKRKHISANRGQMSFHLGVIFLFCLDFCSGNGQHSARINSTLRGTGQH